MKVHTEWQVGTNLFDIWIFEQDFSGKTRQLAIAGVDSWEWQEVEEGEKPKPTLTLPNQVYRALSAKLNGVLPPSEATERHLQDALQTRDRLFDFFMQPRKDQA